MTALLTATIAPAPRTHDRFNTAACLAIGAAISGYCIAEPAPLLAVFALPILALGWWLARDGAPPLLPRIAVNVLVLAAIARAFFLVSGSADPIVSHLSEFLVLIQLIKLFDRRSPRDEAQLLSLSLFIVIGALLTSNSLGVGLLLLIYTPLATAATMLLQIRAGLTRARGGAATTDGSRAVFAADLARPGPRARSARRHFLGVVSVAILLSFVSAFVIFLLTPRGLGQDRFGRLGQRQGDAVIGFNDQVNLGTVNSLGQDTTPVMDVRVTDERGRPLGSDARALHLRGAVLDTYDPEQRTWRPLGGRRFGGGNHTLAPGRRNDIAEPAGGRMIYRQDVTVRDAFAARNSYLFAVWAPIAVEFPGEEALSRTGRDLILRRNSSSSRNVRYTIWSDLEGAVPLRRSRRFSRPPVPLEERAAPFQTGRIRDLAARLLADRSISLDPAERDAAATRAAANAFVEYLRASCEYSTTDLAAPRAGLDPIEMFLFETRRGHCEYFASAMVAMCHAVGIDARLVTGYLATEFSPATGQYLVRQSNAHAWAEVCLDPEIGRWVTMDPSPPAALDLIHRPGTGPLARLRRLYDAIDFAWNDAVVSFDDRRRSALLGRFIGEDSPLAGVAAAVRRAGERFASLVSFSRSGARIAQWAILGGAVLIVASFVIGFRIPLRRLWRKRRPTSALAAADPQLRRLLAGVVFYDRALDLLDRAGLGKPPSRPPMAHADALASDHPELAAAFRSLAALYYRPRFARVPLSEEESAEARRLLGHLAAGIEALANPPAAASR